MLRPPETWDFAISSSRPWSGPATTTSFDFRRRRTVARSSFQLLTWMPMNTPTTTITRSIQIAGRIISQTHEADMWTRGMYCCMMTGQCAGIAAALAARTGAAPRKLDVSALQREIGRQGLDLGSRAQAA